MRLLLIILIILLLVGAFPVHQRWGYGPAGGLGLIVVLLILLLLFGGL